LSKLFFFGLCSESSIQHTATGFQRPP
jgi:hypothetical protein